MAPHWARARPGYPSRRCARWGSAAWLGACAFVVGLLFPAALFAQEAGVTGPELRSVDASVGPVQGGTRVVGLGGAFTAIAVGVEGMSSNAAAVAVRTDYSWTDWDVGFGLDVGIGAWLPETNLVNTSNPEEGEEEVEQRSLLFGSLSFSLQYQQFGLGVSADGRQQGLRGGQSTDAPAGLSPRDLSGNFGILYAAVGYAFLDRDLVVGVGPRVTGLSFVGLSDALGSSSLRVAGIGYHLGVIYKPRRERFRVGVSYKSSITQSVEESADPQSVWEPDAVELPWEAAVGFAYQLGLRPLNPPFVSIQKSVASAGAPARLRRPSRQLATRAELEEQARREASRRYHSRSRRGWLLTTELRVVGGVDDSVGFTALFGAGPSGSTSAPSFSPRFGVETEAVPHWLKLRAGSYWEPARIAEASSRLHGTLGFDVKLFQWNVFGLIGEFDWWQLSAAGDVAENYLNTVVSLGFWH